MGQRGEEKGTNFRGILATWLIREPPRRARQGVRDRKKSQAERTRLYKLLLERVLLQITEREREREEERD